MDDTAMLTLKIDWGPHRAGDVVLVDRERAKTLRRRKMVEAKHPRKARKGKGGR